MNTNVINGFNLEPTTDTHTGLLWIARQAIAHREAMSGIGGWVHSLAMKFNNPSAGVVSSKQFENFMIKEIDDFLNSPDCKALVDFQANDLKLTGKNPLSSAFRKIKATMAFGGDLSVLDTISKCQRFNSDEAKKKDDQQVAQQAREEIVAGLLAKGIDPTSPQGKQMIEDEMSLLFSVHNGSKPTKKDDTEADDKWDTLGKEFAEALRQLAEGETNNAQAAQEQAEFAIFKLKDMYTKQLLNIAKTRGLVAESAAA